MKFTFKRNKKQTGLAAVGNPYPNVQIKQKGKVVGEISAPNWQTKDRQWRIRFMIRRTPTPMDSCPKEWITLKFKGTTEDECRNFIVDNAEALCKYDLYPIE